MIIIYVKLFYEQTIEVEQCKKTHCAIQLYYSLTISIILVLNKFSAANVTLDILLTHMKIRLTFLFIQWITQSKSLVEFTKNLIYSKIFI